MFNKYPGPWFLIPDLWCLVQISWFQIYIIDPGSWFQNYISKPGSKSWILSLGSNCI